ncbi:hypothetical protein D3C87_1439190 [compost metagenome]
MVQTRARVLQEYDVLGAGLAEHESRNQLLVQRHVFGDAKTHLSVEIGLLLHVRHLDLVVVEAHRRATFEVLKLRVHARRRGHRGAELHRGAGRVIDQQRTALMRHFDPAGRQAFGFIEVRGLVQLFFGVHPKTDGFGRVLAVVALDHQTVVANLFQTAEIQGVGIAFGQHQANDLFVKIATGFQVA